MQEYDATLKLLLRGSAKVTMREVTGGAIENWLDVELPKVQNLRVDLLGETGDASLVHLELQSTNDAMMPLRMAEYCLGGAMALDQLLILAGLRRLEETVEEETRRMPLMDSILDNKVLGREYKRGMEEGKAEGERTILRGQIEKRFGPIPAWADEQLRARSAVELEAIGIRVLDAPSLEDLLH